MNDDLDVLTNDQLFTKLIRLRQHIAVLATRRAKITQILGQRRLGEPEPIGVTTDENGVIITDGLDGAADTGAIRLIAGRIESFAEARDEPAGLLDEHGVADDDTDS